MMCYTRKFFTRLHKLLSVTSLKIARLLPPILTVAQLHAPGQ